MDIEPSPMSRDHTQQSLNILNAEHNKADRAPIVSDSRWNECTAVLSRGSCDTASLGRVQKASYIC
jgi:hypothetical protein